MHIIPVLGKDNSQRISVKTRQFQRDKKRGLLDKFLLEFLKLIRRWSVSS